VKLIRLLAVPAAPLLALFLLSLPGIGAQSTKKGGTAPSAKAAPAKSAAAKQTTTTKAPAKAAPQVSAKSSKAPAGSGKATKATASRGAATKGSARGRTVATRTRTGTRTPSQMQPEPARVREIQQALADRGYPLEPTGVWGSESVEALKKFQESQNINNLSGRGKLDPLTLIALGLGPRREPLPKSPTPDATAPTEGKIQ